MDARHSLDVLYSTTALIEVDTENGTGRGTGLFFEVPNDYGPASPVLVTNRHVVDGAHVLNTIADNISRLRSED